jgi:hypothetical protein
MDDVGMLCEIRGVYDGWSWAILKDGRAVNRWEPEDGRRYRIAQRCVDDFNSGGDGWPADLMDTK